MCQHCGEHDGGVVTAVCELWCGDLVFRMPGYSMSTRHHHPHGYAMPEETELVIDDDVKYNPH